MEFRLGEVGLVVCLKNTNTNENIIYIHIFLLHILHSSPQSKMSIYPYIKVKASIALLPFSKSLFLYVCPKTNMLDASLVYRLICRDTVVCIFATPNFLLFLLQSLFLILCCPWFLTSSLFHLPPSFILLLLLLLQQIPRFLPPLHPLLPEGFQKLLHNAFQIITVYALWIRADMADIVECDKKDSGIKFLIACFAD